MTGARFAILDSSIYIDNLRTGRFKEEILELPFVVRCSAVVLAELSRGARSRSMKKFVDELEKKSRVITPTEAEWAESGRIVGRIAAAKHYDAQKTRDIHFDVLIAMGARQIGAVLITRNADDFKTILGFMSFNLVGW